MSIGAKAYDFEQNGIYYNILSTKDKTVEVTYGTNLYSGDVIINGSVEFRNVAYMVVAISKSAFHLCDNLKSVKLPETITNIGESAFSVCHNLESVELPDGVTTIGQFAFHYCDKLTTLTIPSGVAVLSSCTFSNCAKLSSIVLPESLTEIGFECFEYCERLSNINLPSQLRKIDDYAFNGCKHLASLAIPDNVWYIGEYTFANCESLMTLDISKSISTIKEKAFGNCNAITNIRLYQEYPIPIPDNAFPGIVKLNATLYVPKGTKEQFESSGSWGGFSNIVEMESSGLSSVRINRKNGKSYTLNGTKATPTTKGVIIQNGKKRICK